MGNPDMATFLQMVYDSMLPHYGLVVRLLQWCWNMQPRLSSIQMEILGGKSLEIFHPGRAFFLYMLWNCVLSEYRDILRKIEGLEQILLALIVASKRQEYLQATTAVAWSLKWIVRNDFEEFV